MTEDTMSQRALAAMRPTGPEPLAPISYADPLGWYAVYCSPRCEERVQKGLKESGFPTFLPRETRWKAVRGKRTKVAFPLFRGYVFLAFDPNKAGWWDGVQGIDGIEYLLQNNQMPMRFHSAKIEELRRMEQNGFFDFTQESLPEPGTTMEVADGPFKGFMGKVKSATPSKRIILLIDYLGKQVTTNFPLGALEQIR